MAKKKRNGKQRQYRRFGKAGPLTITFADGRKVTTRALAHGSPERRIEIVRMLRDGTFFGDAPAKHRRAGRAERRRQYDDYLASAAWRRVRRAWYAKHARICCLCGSFSDLQLHHLTYRHVYAELDHLDDLVCLCGKCHRSAHERSAA